MLTTSFALALATCICVLVYFQSCLANPLFPLRPTSCLDPNLISEPTCTDPLDTSSNNSSPQLLHAFPARSRIPKHPPPRVSADGMQADVLDDPDAEVQFAQVQIADDFRALFSRGVRGRGDRPSAGFIHVGSRQVFKLSVGPTPVGGRHNLTAGGRSVTEKVEGLDQAA